MSFTNSSVKMTMTHSVIVYCCVFLQAMDKDSGKFGQIEYELVPESNRGGYFSVGRSSGLLRTEREMTSVPHDLLPFNLTLKAHDNPNSDAEDSHSTSVPVVVSFSTYVTEVFSVPENPCRRF